MPERPADGPPLVSHTPAQLAFPVLQDGMMIDLLPWQVLHDVDTSTVDLGGAGRITFSATATPGRSGLCVDVFLDCRDAQEVLPALTFDQELPPLASEAAWSASDLGLTYSEFVSDVELARLDEYPALAGYLGSLRRRISALVDDARDLVDQQ